MLSLTKLFYFELAHAIHGYSDDCENIHGHSYKLEVTITSAQKKEDYIAAPGFIIDFKELKQIVNSSIIKQFDHRLVLSKDFLRTHPELKNQANLVTWEIEPSAENLLLYIRNVLSGKLPAYVKLVKLKLNETKDSFAEWINN